MSRDEAHQRAYEQWAAYCRRHEGGHPWGDRYFQRWFDWRAGWWTVLMEAAGLNDDAE